MKRLALLLGAWALVTQLSAAIYPMEAGNLRRYNQAQGLTQVVFPLDVLWSANVCAGVPRSNPVVLDDRIVQAFQGGVVCMSRFDGKVIWRAGAIGDQWNPPAYDVDRNLLYESSRAGSLSALRVSDGVEMWHYYEGASKGCFNLASCTYWQNKIYLGTATGKLLCLDADTHAILWSLVTGVKGGIGTPAMDLGEIYVATLAGKILRVDALTGALAWQVSAPGNCYGSAVSLDDTRIFLMTTNGLVECRSRSNGALLWSFQTGSFTLSNLSQGPQGLYCSSDDRCMYRLDPNTGAVLWKTCFTGNFARSAPFCAGDLVLGSGCTGIFYGVNAGTGTGTWNLTHGAWNSFTDFAEADGLIFVCNLSGVMYCLHPKNAAFPPTVTATPSVTATMTPSSTASPTITATGTATPSSTATSTGTATQTASPSSSATPSATSSATPTGTATSSATSTPSSSATLTPSQTGTPSVTPTLTASATNTVQVTFAPTVDVNGDDGKRDPGEGHCYVSPNPVHGGPCRFVYRMRAPGTCKLRLFQASGDPVGLVEDRHSTAGVHSSEVSTQRYAPGVYFCKAKLSYDQGDADDLPLTKFLVLKAR